MKQILQSAKDYIASRSKIRTAGLIALELPGSSAQNPIYAYFTDYFRDVTYNGILFRSGKVKTIGNHKQDRNLTIGSLSFTITGNDNDEIMRIVEAGVSFLDRQVIIYQAIIDDNGDILPVDPATNGPLIFFKGRVTGGGIQEEVPTNNNAGSSTITWTCSNQFYDFDRVNGRLTDDATHRGLEIIDGQLYPGSGAKRLEYQDDYGFAYSNNTVNILAKYQVKELRYKMKKTKKFFGLSSSYSLKEYYETVTKEVDLDFNLAAKYLPVVYGVQNVAGIPIFADTELHNPNVVYIVYAFCEGEIDGFLDFNFSDAPMICYDIPDSSTRTCFGSKKLVGDTMQRIATGASTTAPSTHGQEYIYNDGNGEIRIWTYHGKRDQNAASVLVNLAAQKGFYLQNLNGKGPEYWDSRFKLLDTAYAIVKVTINENRTDIPDITADIQGKKVRVYKADGTVDNSKTSLNGIWQTLDYVTSDIYGAGIDLNEINVSQLVQEAAILDIVDTSYEPSWNTYWRYTGWTSLGQENRQIVQMNTILDGADSVFKNVQGLLDSFQGSINNLSGEYRVTVEKYSETPLKINFLDTLGSIELSDTTGKTKYNSVQASLIDPAMGWKTNSIVFYNSLYKAQDKNLDKKMQLSFANITNYYTARGMAERELKKSRYSREVSIELPYTFLGLEVNDPVALTYSRWNWTDKFFLISEVENQRNGKINVTLREYAKDVFINSQQVNDSSGIPDITNNVLPPRDFLYTPTPVGTSIGNIGKNGELSWLPSVTSNVIYYTIHQTDRLLPYVIDQVNVDANTRLKQDIMGQPPGMYVFEIRAVDIYGRRSAPVTMTVELNAAKNLSVVPNFRVTNKPPADATQFVGADIKYAWDPIPEEKLIPGIFYTLELYDSVNNMIRSMELRNGYIYDYFLIYNKADYALFHESKLGINRQVFARIRAEGPNGERSVAWATI